MHDLLCVPNSVPLRMLRSFCQSDYRNRDNLLQQLLRESNCFMNSRVFLHILLVVGIVIDGTLSIGECDSACLRSPVSGFVTLAQAAEGRNASLVDPADNSTFTFISFNVPNLLRVEVLTLIL